MTTSRTSILDGLYLSDGVTLAKDAAFANGVSEAIFRLRLKRGISPDEAVKPVEDKPHSFQRGEYERPYLSHAEWEFQQLCGLATLSDGRPAWPLAHANGISEKTFRVRLARGWSPERASSEVTRKMKPPKCVDEWEAYAVENGISLRAFRSRLRAGWPEAIAATRPLR